MSYKITNTARTPIRLMADSLIGLSEDRFLHPGNSLDLVTINWRLKTMEKKKVIRIQKVEFKHEYQSSDMESLDNTETEYTDEGEENDS